MFFQSFFIAFLPIPLSCKWWLTAALAFRPKVLYAYHFGDTDTRTIVSLLKGGDINVRIRNMK